MIRWKDFLYFPKGDKIAIILLLILICITGGIIFYMNNFTGLESEYIYKKEEARKDFANFENNMEPVEQIQENEPDKPTLFNKQESNLIEKKIVKQSGKGKDKAAKLTEGQTIDINSASKTTLTRIPGIGDVFAERILEYRKSLGGFVSLDQLREIKGISINKYSKIQPYLVLNKKHRYIKINSDSNEYLTVHPYLSEIQVKTIISLRKEGKIKSIEILSDTGNFPPRDINRLIPYLSFE